MISANSQQLVCMLITAAPPFTHAAGEHVGALAMSEPNAGSDVVSMRCRAGGEGGWVGLLAVAGRDAGSNGQALAPKAGCCVHAPAACIPVRQHNSVGLLACRKEGRLLCAEWIQDVDHQRAHCK